MFGNVSWDDWEWCGLSKRFAKPMNESPGNANIAFGEADPAKSAYKEAMREYHLLRKSLREDKKSGEGFHPENYPSEFAGVLGQMRENAAQVVRMSQAATA